MSRNIEALGLSSEFGEYVLFIVPFGDAHVPEVLSRAEREVVALVLAGESNAQIATRRRTSKNTVANQLAAIYRKLQIAGRTELVRYCCDARASHVR